MRFLNFTPQETKALIFLLAALLVGSGISLYKRTHPQFAPELILEEKETDPQKKVESPLDHAERRKKINLNQATSAELEVLPDLGPILSRRIVEYREANGPFHRIEELLQVPGIGEKTFQRIRDYVRVE